MKLHFFANCFCQIQGQGMRMNSNLEKFFHGIGEGYLQSSSKESRHRNVAFTGPDKRNNSKNQLSRQREQLNHGAMMVVVIVTVWTAIFFGFVVAAMFNP
jgi:hypothetical protein